MQILAAIEAQNYWMEVANVKLSAALSMGGLTH